MNLPPPHTPQLCGSATDVLFAANSTPHKQDVDKHRFPGVIRINKSIERIKKPPNRGLEFHLRSNGSLDAYSPSSQ